MNVPVRFTSIKLFNKLFITFLQKHNMYKMNEIRMLQMVQSCIPRLDDKSHKGQAGRIGVIGGSVEYTGAPYFAGISALKVGADLVHIFCTSPAAPVIKSYSPDLIVHPLLDKPNATVEISTWLERLHTIVIGPGLGREANTFKVVTELINVIHEKKIPLIIDADGLFLITEKPELIKNFTTPVILTPNKIEFERLCTKLNGLEGLKYLGQNVTILEKGKTDKFISTNPDVQWESKNPITNGSGRRCGGQGDVLSGLIATFLHWTLLNVDKGNISVKADKTLVASSLACYGGSALVKLCNKKAFDAKGRSMLASDMIEYIHEAFEQLYGV